MTRDHSRAADSRGPADKPPSKQPAARQDHFFADPDEVVLGAVDTFDESRPPSSLWSDAWSSLRRQPLFWVATALTLLIIVVALFPGLFSSADPQYCTLTEHLEKPRAGHPFGFDRQGCDVYSRVVYGARASVTVGLLATLFASLIGTVIGATAGYYGGWADSILARLTDIFYAIPVILAAIVVMQVFRSRATVFSVVVVISLFAWVNVARIARGAVMGVKNADFITAATALGVSRFRILLRHVLPNAVAPIIVTATTQLGTFIVLEATLSFLGLGLPSSIVSWGQDISSAQANLRTDPALLFYPAGALALTVLAFIMMGDAVRDALDPKAVRR
ncbi:MAG: ABC transporter permease [Bifidobacteriaceae bacterium]|jgi:oligopeptide transport system permease protein|nr:ABC transporter permease [Bifidobacteriaceae bacterium]